MLLAEISYRKQEWHRARELYTALERVPDVAEVVPREQIVQRRAALAQRLGDTAEAEALYRELAILSPRHVEARRVLAELALARGDTATAALRLEELLRLLPAGSSADLGDLRHRLGAIYAETGEWNGARYYLELVVDQDPSRLPALELLLQTYQKLDLHHEAAEACGRLARLYPDRAHRAAVLYRQAEIRRNELGDEPGALDAYLRSSDADPHFVPSRLRLIDHFWAEGDIDVVADLAGDLADVQLSVDTEADLVARLAIAVAGPRSTTPARFSLAEHPVLIEAGVRVLAQAGDRAAARGVDTIDPFLTRARFWAGAEGERALVAALIELVLADPARPGPAIVLGGLAARTRRLALARAAYSLPAFVQPDGLGGKLLELLPAAESVHPEAVRAGTPVDHPDVAGPVRRALSRLAPALLGLDYDQPAPKPLEGSGLPPARAIELRRIADLLGRARLRGRARRRRAAANAVAAGRAAAAAPHPLAARGPPHQPGCGAARAAGLVVRGRARHRSAAQRPGDGGVDRRRRVGAPARGGARGAGGRRLRRAAGPRGGRLVDPPGGGGDARIARGARRAAGRGRGGADRPARLADVPARHAPHLQPDRPAGLAAARSTRCWSSPRGSCSATTTSRRPPPSAASFCAASRRVSSSPSCSRPPTRPRPRRNRVAESEARCARFSARLDRSRPWPRRSRAPARWRPSLGPGWWRATATTESSIRSIRYSPGRRCRTRIWSRGPR